jgi:hypothetical protein
MALIAEAHDGHANLCEALKKGVLCQMKVYFLLRKIGRTLA